MKTSLSKVVQVFAGRGGASSHGHGKHTQGSDRHPYLKAEFWNQPTHRFWNSPHHTEASKEYFESVHPMTQS